MPSAVRWTIPTKDAQKVGLLVLQTLLCGPLNLSTNHRIAANWQYHCFKLHLLVHWCTCNNIHITIIRKGLVRKVNRNKSCCCCYGSFFSFPSLCFSVIVYMFYALNDVTIIRKLESEYFKLWPLASSFLAFLSFFWIVTIDKKK